jgi:hypothetical protein
MEWIEIQAHRILVVGKREFGEEFETLTEKGEAPSFGEAIYRVIRKRDRKIFKLARFQPIDSFSLDLIALEEV